MNSKFIKIKHIYLINHNVIVDLLQHKLKLSITNACTARIFNAVPQNILQNAKK